MKLFAHLKPESYEILHKTEAGKLIPNPIPVKDLGWHYLTQGTNEGMITVKLVYAFNIDEDRLSQEAKNVLFWRNWHDGCNPNAPTLLHLHCIHFLSC